MVMLYLVLIIIIIYLLYSCNTSALTDVKQCLTIYLFIIIYSNKHLSVNVLVIIIHKHIENIYSINYE